MRASCQGKAHKHQSHARCCKAKNTGARAVAPSALRQLRARRGFPPLLALTPLAALHFMLSVFHAARAASSSHEASQFPLQEGRRPEAHPSCSSSLAVRGQNPTQGLSSCALLLCQATCCGSACRACALLLVIEQLPALDPGDHAVCQLVKVGVQVPQLLPHLRAKSEVEGGLD